MGLREIQGSGFYPGSGPELPAAPRQVRHPRGCASEEEPGGSVHARRDDEEDQEREQEQARCELYIDTTDPDEVTRRFAELGEHREAIDAALGSPLSWEPPVEGRRRAARIGAHRPGDVTDLDRHDEYIDWFVTTFERLRGALDPYLARR
jgi:hypothetical protein